MTDQNDLSTLTLRPYTEITSVQLPTRAEKRMIPTLVDLGDGVTIDDFERTAALAPYDQYVLIRIPGRGTDSQGNPDTTQSVYFQFLINPSQVTVNRQTLDEMALSRSGWQIGVWGEGPPSVNLQGKTPGRYFSYGLVDIVSEYTMSYRSIAALEVVFENNGYWFEGEQIAEGPLAADSSRRRIKMHQTIQLCVGEFIWEGCFESMSVSENADSPYLDDFELNFTVWREMFRYGTPYPNSIGRVIERGHTAQGPLALNNVPKKKTASTDTTQTLPSGTVDTSNLPANINPTSPALATTVNSTALASTIQLPSLGGTA